MAEYFLGQVMPLAFSFAPRGFAQCNGQLLPIAQNQALFSLLGVYYGGNGQTNFMLPDLRGRTPVGAGGGYQYGETGGVESVTLQTPSLPAHNHLGMATTTTAAARNPTNSLYGAFAGQPIYGPSSGPQVALNPVSLGSNGGDLPHENMQPFSVINFCIALTGIFPSRN
jgi:microcystin-dependent protein